MPLKTNTALCIALCAGVAVSVAGAALAGTCTATMSDFDFGDQSLRGGSTDTIYGTLRVDCGPLLGPLNLNTTVCISVGAGGGGAGPSNNPRYMLRADDSILEYQLFRAGGAPLNEITNIQLSLLGSSVFEEVIHAEITDTGGAAVKGGSYASNFTGGIDFTVTAGLLSCADPQATGSFTVSANIVPSCSVSAGTLDFGTLGTNVTAPITGQTTIDVACSDGIPYSVYLDQGTGPGVADPTGRKMVSGSNTLSYGLYRNVGLTSSWGWTAGFDGLSATGTGAVQSIPVYGQINAGQTAPTGTYNDTVVITVEY